MENKREKSPDKKKKGQGKGKKEGAVKKVKASTNDDSAEKKNSNDISGFGTSQADTADMNQQQEELLEQAVTKAKGPTKKKKKGAAKKEEDEEEEVKLMDLLEIEKRMEDKIQQFQSKMKEMDKQKIQPITIKLIQKYSFTRKFKNQHLNLQMNEGAADTEVDAKSTDISDLQSEISEITTTGIVPQDQLPDESAIAEKMIYLRTIRLDFLDVGPKIENLEIFEHLENLYLQYNKIHEIGIGLQMNVNLVFLALHNNQIKNIEGLSHLKKLAYLDLSNNMIEEVPAELQKHLPCDSLMIFKLQGNPLPQEKLSQYRKQIVLAMPKLEEFDRIKVVQAERMAYKGLVRVDVEKLLSGYKTERADKDAKEKMERELYLDFMQEKGLESQQRMMNSLEDFAKLDEFTSLKKQFTDMLSEHKQQRELLESQQMKKTKEIDEKVGEVMTRYSRQSSRQNL